MYTAHEPFLDRAVLTHVDSRGGSSSGAWLYTPYLKYIPSYGLVFFDCSKFSIIFFEKKNMKFWDNYHNFYYFWKTIRSRLHLPNLSMLTSLFSKNMSKCRANDHFLFVLIFYSQVKKKKKKDFWYFCYEVYKFSQLKNP